jgi:hypothetical protein
LNSQDPACAFPDIFLEGSPKQASGSAEKAPGAAQTLTAERHLLN